MTRLVTEGELAAFGTGLGQSLPSGAVVWLQGEMGAGKTTLVKSIVSGLGVRDAATSPTYGLVHRYEGRRGPVFHVDCFRLRTPDEGRDLDWEGLVGGDALLVEWPERAGVWAAAPTLIIRLGHAEQPDQRWLDEVAC